MEPVTFSVCVVGYRAWRIDAEGRLGSLRHDPRPWVPGVNTARCTARGAPTTRLTWSGQEGAHWLEPTPRHLAPDAGCECGLYSWRRPSERWADPPRPSPALVVGAVASWGALRVHRDGFRAEHACVVTLAVRPGERPRTRTRLALAAERYGVELVCLDELEAAASRHGDPLPVDFGPPAVPAPT